MEKKRQFSGTYHISQELQI